MKKMTLLTYLAYGFILLGGVGAVTIAIIQSINSARDKEEIISTTMEQNATLKSDNATLKQDIVQLKKTISDNDKKIQANNDTIIELNNRLSEKSEYIANFVTGANGYPVLKFGSFATSDNNPKKGAFILETSSKFPIYDLEVKLFDYDVLLDSRKFNPTIGSYTISEKELGRAEVGFRKSENLVPDIPANFGSVITLKESKYLAHFFARNNLFIQRMIFKEYHSGIHFAYQVYNWQGTTLLEQGFGTNDYPIDEQKSLIKELESIDLKLSIVKSE